MRIKIIILIIKAPRRTR